MNHTRRRFLANAGMVLAGTGIAVVVSACGGDDETGETNGALSCSAGDISSNHGHALDVSEADIKAAAEKTYSIQGEGAHDHQITVSAADFAALESGTDVVVTSTTDASHSHSVTLRCA